MSRSTRKSEVLIKQWKEALFDQQMPGGALDLADLDSIVGASGLPGGGCCSDHCSANSCCNNGSVTCGPAN